MGAIDIGEIQTRQLFQARPDVDAIICFNDLLAIGAIRACQTLGIDVPRQVSIVGFDNILMGQLITPRLQHFRYPSMGWEPKPLKWSSKKLKLESHWKK